MSQQIHAFVLRDIQAFDACRWPKSPEAMVDNRIWGLAATAIIAMVLLIITGPPTSKTAHLACKQTPGMQVHTCRSARHSPVYTNLHFTVGDLRRKLFLRS